MEAEQRTYRRIRPEMTYFDLRGVPVENAIANDPAHEERIRQHEARVQAELANEPAEQAWHEARARARTDRRAVLVHVGTSGGTVPRLRLEAVFGWSHSRTDGALRIVWFEREKGMVRLTRAGWAEFARIQKEESL